MTAAAEEILVQPDAYRAARTTMLLMARLRAALTICIHDDTQGVGGMLHLRYVATENGRPLELTDNTLSSNLLLLDRFCKELRSLGARKHSWRVRIVGHVPDTRDMDAPSATVIDLLKAYFADSRLPPECREVRKLDGLAVRFEAREGRLWVHGLTEAGTATVAQAI